MYLLETKSMMSEVDNGGKRWFELMPTQMQRMPADMMLRLQPHLSAHVAPELKAWSDSDGLLLQLIRLGADVNVKSGARGEPAVHTAARLGKYERMETLLGYGASAQGVDDNGYTLLHCSVIGGCTVCLCCALEQPGVDVNQKTTDTGETALHLAMKHSATNKVGQRMWDLLVQRGADKNAEDKTGATPRDLIPSANARHSQESSRVATAEANRKAASNRESAAIAAEIAQSRAAEKERRMDRWARY